MMRPGYGLALKRRDLDRIESRAHWPADKFARFSLGLLQRAAGGPRLRTDTQRVAASKRLVEQLGEFETEVLVGTTAIDYAMKTAFLDHANRGRVAASLRTLGELLRGYTTAALDSEVRDVRDVARRLRREIAKERTRLNRQLMRSRQRGYVGQAVLQEQHASKLTELLKGVDEILTTPEALAVRRLRRSVTARRNPALARLLGQFSLLNPDPLEHLDLRFRLVPNSQTTFPLRHCSEMGVPDWRELNRMWGEGHSQEEILLEFSRREKISNLLRTASATHASLASAGFPDRTRAFREIEDALSRSDHLAALTLSITQAEGVIWDIAARLNRRQIRIYTRRVRNGRSVKCSFLWDPQTQRYRRDSSGRLGNRPVHSARQLILDTRLRSLLETECFSYLVDEFSSDRNRVAHGEPIGARNVEADAIAALVTLATCVAEAHRLSSPTA